MQNVKCKIYKKKRPEAPGESCEEALDNKIITLLRDANYVNSYMNFYILFNLE